MLRHWLMKNKHLFQTSRAVEAYSAFRNLWDTPIFESRNFVAVPTVGALVEGWLLIVPRAPVLSFARLPKELFSELEFFLNDVTAAIQSAYGPVSVFEHGPSCAASAVGCGVDYAHLHLVPVDCDLLAGAKQIAPKIQWSRVNSIENIYQYAKNDGGYWFLQQKFGVGECYVGTCPNEKPMSQLFRRVIANHVGRPSDFDWKQYAGEVEIAATVEKLTDAAVLV
jgi:diadenosine tetraphosphate (Ap4A) HIT family hydrolase